MKHWFLDHPEEVDPPKFRVRFIGSYKDAMSRQVKEAIRIQNRPGSLNSKGEYGGGRITRLVVEKSAVDKKKEEIKTRRKQEEEDVLWENFLMKKQGATEKRKGKAGEDGVPAPKRARIGLEEQLSSPVEEVGPEAGGGGVAPTNKMKIQNPPSSQGSTAASSIAPASPGSLEEQSSSPVEGVRLEEQLSSQVEEGRLAWDGTPTGVAMSNMQDVMETSTVDPNGSNTRDVGLEIVGHPPTVLAGTRTPTSMKKVTGVMVMGSRKVKGAPVMSVRDIADHFRSLNNKTPVKGVKKTSLKKK